MPPVQLMFSVVPDEMMIAACAEIGASNAAANIPKLALLRKEASCIVPSLFLSTAYHHG
jgi:hypothetical protein